VLRLLRLQQDMLIHRCLLLKLVLERLALLVVLLPEQELLEALVALLGYWAEVALEQALALDLPQE
jgi:hypothetical protein